MIHAPGCGATRRTRAARVAAGLLAGALAGPAAEASAEPPPDEPARTSEDDARSSEDDARSYFDLGWDAGPTYEIGQRFRRRDGFEWAEAAREVSLRGRIGGSLSLDGGYLAGDALSDGWKFAVRRARFYTRGEFYLLFPTEFKVEFGVEDKSVFLNDFFLRWHPKRWVDSVRFGYFDPPISLEALASSSDRSLMETGSPVAAFAPGFRLGIEATGANADPSLTWNLNLSSVGQSQPNAEAGSSALRAVGRLAWRPLGDDVTDRLIHLGTSLSYVVSGGGAIRYRARPETFLTPYLVDTGDLDADAALLGMEAAWRQDRLTLQAEYLHSFVDAQEGGSLGFYGLYLQGSIVLTGETRPYDVATATFGRIAPAAPYKPFKGRFGALELAGRVAWLDLSDGPVSGGTMVSLGFGPTWTLNRWVRVLAGYVYAHVDDGPSGGSNAHIAQARLELRL